MTIEEKFFKTFGIEPIKVEVPSREYDSNGEVCSFYVEESYPEITDRILLELIEILREYYKLVFWRTGDSKCLDICGDKRTNVLYRTCDTLRNSILNSLICMQKENKNLKQQVRSLFEEK